MIKFKKRISSAMVTIFTAMVVLSATSTGAFAWSRATDVSILYSAQTSVSSAYFILSTSAYDLTVGQGPLSKANTAIIKAKISIDRLNLNSADYKILNSRINAYLTRMVNARKNIVAVKAAEASAVAAADAAIKAIEAAPIVTVSDLTAVKALQLKANLAIANVKGSDNIKNFKARLKIVADNVASL